MSLFDFPRINFKGVITMNPGTANNDDYAVTEVLPESWGPPFAGQPLGLLDSKLVEPRNYGLSDEEFIEWVQKAQPFVKTKDGSEVHIIPAEWNYYGSMGICIKEARIVGVQTGPEQKHPECNDDGPLSGLIGADLSFTGTLTDVNPEGSPPATQFMLDNLTVEKDGTSFLCVNPTKGVGLWINFYRNINLTADAGAGSYVHHIAKFKDGDQRPPGFEAPDIIGIVFRYYLSRAIGDETSNEKIEELYKKGETNTKDLEISGTIAPLCEGEYYTAMPTGRFLTSDKPNVPTPPDTQNNGGSANLVALGPAVVQQNGNWISGDFCGTFPDYFQDGKNPKYFFGPVSLVVSNACDSATIGKVNYADTAKNYARGGLFDFDLSGNAAALELLADPTASLKLVHCYGEVLAETDYYFVSNQQSVYAEQHGPGDEFLNQGTTEPASVAVFFRGNELIDDCPPVTVWQYLSTPLQSPGDISCPPIDTNYCPGQPLNIDTSQPGNLLLTFGVEGSTPQPPTSYSTFMNPPWVTNASQLNIRILPNNEDFSEYYVDPGAAEPVGNEALTFDVVYEKVLRTYYLLFPVMNKFFHMNNEEEVKANAPAILRATDPGMWLSTHFMPRTRDMSASKRTLLQAWCRKYPAKKSAIGKKSSVGKKTCFGKQSVSAKQGASD